MTTTGDTQTDCSWKRDLNDFAPGLLPCGQRRTQVGWRVHCEGTSGFTGGSAGPVTVATRSRVHWSRRYHMDVPV